MAEEVKAKAAGAGDAGAINNEIKSQRLVLEGYINKNKTRFQKIAKLGKQQEEEIENLRNSLLNTNRLVEEDFSDIYSKLRGLSKRIRREARFRKTAKYWKQILKKRARIIIQNMESIKESQKMISKEINNLREEMKDQMKDLREEIKKSQEGVLIELQSIARNVNFLMERHHQAVFK